MWAARLASQLTKTNPPRTSSQLPAIDGDWREALAQAQADRQAADRSLAEQRERKLAEAQAAERETHERAHAREQLDRLTDAQRDELHAQVMRRAAGVQRSSWTDGNWQRRFPLALAMHEQAVRRGWCEPFAQEALA